MRLLKKLLIGVVLTIPFACSKNQGDCQLTPLKVLRYDCDRVIFQVLNNDVAGDGQWTDVHNNTTHSNVVSYYNTCEIAALTNGHVGVTLYAKVEKTEQNLTAQDCVQCQAISQDPPVTKVVLSNIQVGSCAENE